MIPLKLQIRPKYKGLPIPFVTFIANGVPDFRANDEIKWQEAITKKLCGLCGFKLEHKIYFIGGEISHKSRLFHDPAMHRECAEYAVKVCPFLAVDSKTYSDRPLNKHSQVITEASNVKTRLAIFTSSGYQIGVVKGVNCIKANNWIEVRWLDELKS